MLRCSFSGHSIVADVAFLVAENLGVDECGEIRDVTLRPPDIQVEIATRQLTRDRSSERLAFSMAHGCPLGWLIDPYKKTIDVFRASQPAEHLQADGVLEGEPVLPGFRLSAAEIFGWLRRGG